MIGDSGSASHWEYVDFDLEIGEESEPRKYPVSVRSPEGEAQEEMRFPFDEWELKDKLRDVEVALLRSGGTRRRIGTPEEQTIQGFGRALFEALLVGEVGTHYRVSWREARRQNKGLRVKLRVRPPELSALPWEFLYDPKRDYLSLSSRTPLVRYPEVPQPIERLTVTPPLRILGMVASPLGLPQLDERHEKRLVEEATKRLQARGLVELTWLEGQTWRDLQRAMRGGPWHIFHFIGHGGFDPETEEGAIALSNEEGRTHLLGAADLALLLDDHYFLRLAFLNSCEGARGSPRDAFSSTAATLVRSGIPAVVAMQYEITDKAAIEFSRSFYEALADGLPVDAVVAEARTAIKMGSALEWGTPVLYMRSEDGLIFDIPPEGERTQPTEAAEEVEDQEVPYRRYREGVQSAWTDGELDRRQVERLRNLANELGLNRSAAADIEREVIGDTIEAILERQEEAAREEERNRRLDDLYAQARRSHQDQEWQAVMDIFAQIHAEDPTYPDPEELLTSTREALDAQESERRVAALYAEGQSHMDAEEWQQALECFEEIQELEPGYRDIEILRSQVRQELFQPPTVEVPDLRYQEVPQAGSMLASTGLEFGDQSEAPSDTVPKGQIIEQSPAAGLKVEAGNPVDVKVSLGPSTVEIPDLAGMNQSQVRNTLRAAGLELGTLGNTQSEDVPEGGVVDQYPAAGTSAKHGDSVRIVVSSGVPSEGVEEAQSGRAAPTSSTDGMQPRVTRPRNPMVLWGGLGAVIVLAAVVVIAIANFPADTSLSESGQAQSGGGSTSVAINLDDTLRDLDSTTATTSVSSDVLANVMSGLYRLDPNDQPVPDMAKGVRISDDKLTYTFTLRDNIKWSNGDPVTSHDFKYAWLKTIDPDTGGQYAYIITSFIKGAAEFNSGGGSAKNVAIETPNDKTLKVTLVNPSPFWLGLTSFWAYYPQNQRFVEQQGEKYAQNADALIYNGPYIMTEFDPTQGVTLKKNTDYWDAENVDVRTVDGKIVRDGDTAVNLYESGDLDVARISGDHVTQYKGKPDFWSQTYFATFYLVPNYDSKIFHNENIRRAFQMGFDSEGLVNKILKDGSQAATGIVPVGIAGPGNQSFREAEGQTAPGYDPQQAKELFQKGVQEVGENPTIELLAFDDSNGRDIATFLQSQFEKMGAKITVNVQPFDRKLELESNGDFQLSWQGWIADYDDPMTFLELWESDSAFNTQKYSNPHYDQLIEDARTETDVTKRMDMLLEAERILVKEDAAIAPTDFQGEAYLVRPSIKGFVDHKYGGGLDVRWWSLKE